MMRAVLITNMSSHADQTSYDAILNTYGYSRWRVCPTELHVWYEQQDLVSGNGVSQGCKGTGHMILGLKRETPNSRNATNPMER